MVEMSTRVETREIYEAVLLCTAPAVSMFLGSACAFKGLAGDNRRLLSSVQYFCAGILFAAIGSELMPKLMSKDSGIQGTIAITVGFCLGIALMLGLGHLTEGDEKQQHVFEDSKQESLLPKSSSSPPVKTAINEDGETQGNANLKRKGNTGSMVADMLLQASGMVACGEQKQIKYKCALPIYVDSMVDGLLIGIVLTASTQAGAIMTLATTFEMGFLGLAFGAMLKPCGFKRWPAAALAPCILVIGGITGVYSAYGLAASPALFHGIVAFGAAALLFLVTHELLTEAKENMGEDEDWHLSVWLFVGFLAVILSRRILADL
jgi:ZIP family zinc transporter